jgi:hypothetical protein
MSNQYIDQIADKAMDIVEEKMINNPTIPEEARHQLEKEEYEKLLAKAEENADYEPEDWDLIDCTQGGLMEGEDES